MNRRPLHNPQVIVLMGVSGTGKSTVGRMLAETLDWDFVDGDDLHPPSNVEKMARGEPLDDADRSPWLDRIRSRIEQALTRGHRGLVVACSALKERYRRQIAGGLEAVALVHLAGDFELIRRRMEARADHYMKPGMLESQFQALEPPADALVVSIEPPPQEVAEQILGQFGRAGRLQ